MAGLWFHQNDKGVVFFLMKIAQTFYFVENFKILAGFSSDGNLK